MHNGDKSKLDPKSVQEWQRSEMLVCYVLQTFYKQVMTDTTLMKNTYGDAREWAYAWLAEQLGIAKTHLKRLTKEEHLRFISTIKSYYLINPLNLTCKSLAVLMVWVHYEMNYVRRLVEGRIEPFKR